MEPKAPDNSQVKRINFITMLLTHPLQSGLTLRFSKCFSLPASGTNRICILIRSVCTVLNQAVTALFIPESLYECWDLFLLLEPYFSQGQYKVASRWGTGSLAGLTKPRTAASCHSVGVLLCDFHRYEGGGTHRTHACGMSRHWVNTGSRHRIAGSGLGSSTCLHASCFHPLSLCSLIYKLDKVPLAMC